MKRCFSLLLAVTMIFFVFSGCDDGGKETVAPTVIGTWSAQVDMADTISELVYTQIGAPTVSVRFPSSMPAGVRAVTVPR